MSVPFTVRFLSMFRWEVVRGDMLMSVFSTRDQASAYCLRKNAEAAR